MEKKFPNPKNPPINPMYYSSRSLTRFSLVSLSLALACVQASASNLYWDPSGSGSSGIGGSGTWQNGGTLDWVNSSTGVGTYSAWSNANFDTAIFGGTSGTVNVSGGVSANLLQFSSGGYSLSGGDITLKSLDNTLANRVIYLETASADVTVNNKIILDSASRTSGQAYYSIDNATAKTLTINGNVELANAVATGYRSLSLNQTNASGVIVFNGSYSGAAGITTSLRIGNASTSVSSATYYINGNNSALTDGNTADISRGIVYVGNSNALGSSVVRVGNGSAVNDSVQLLTNGAVAVVNNLQIWTASTNTPRSAVERLINPPLRDRSTWRPGQRTTV